MLSHKRTNVVWFHSYKVLRVLKSQRQKNEGDQGLWEGGNGELTFMGAELQFRKVKMFWKWIVDDSFTTV